MKNSRAFTLVELMIVVAIVAILAAVAIPSYKSYVKRSYLNEATTSISSIKSAEESYFSINGCYISASPTPQNPPQGTEVAWPTSPTGAWARNALGVRPDRLVRFSYEVYASNSVNPTTGGCGTTTGSRPTSIGFSGCVGSAQTSALIPSSVFPTHYYVVTAKGDLDGDGIYSQLTSAIDDSSILYCNELE